MWKTLAVSFLFVVPVFGQEQQGTAYDALRVIGNQLGRDSVNRIISVTGVDGNPQPETWTVLLNDRRGGTRELQVANGRIESDRRPEGSVVGSTEGAMINTSRLNLDSSGAYAVASHTAEKSHTNFSLTSYTLRTDEHGEPIWIVTLQTRSRRPVGTIYIGANHGTVTRTEGLFAGTNMEDVETDRDAHREDEDNGRGVINEYKARIRRTFLHVQDETRDMFDRVKRSFNDFINRD
jgi:hypothetical protein